MPYIGRMIIILWLSIIILLLWLLVVKDNQFDICMCMYSCMYT